MTGLAIRWRALLAAGLLGSGVLLAAAPAQAVYQCGDQKDTCKCGGVPNPFPCCSNGGNCTWWAWEAACCHWHVDVPMRHDAKYWAETARKDPNYKVLSYPVVNSIAVYDQGKWGHVAWVEAVNGDKITVSEMKCGGDYGMHHTVYYARQFTGGFIVRANQQCECSAGQSETQPCGTKCGHKTRTCSDGCNWSPWSACEGEGLCSVGDKNTQPCGNCGSQEQSCQPNCQWGPWSACQGPDPAGGTQSCPTGLPGVCAAGTTRCVNGNLQCVQNVQASQEQCNGQDDDCDGQTDEDNVCGGNPPPEPQQDASTGQGGAASSDAGPLPEASGPTKSGRLGGADEADGCACRVAAPVDLPDGRGPWFLVIATLGAWLVRRRNNQDRRQRLA